MAKETQGNSSSNSESIGGSNSIMKQKRARKSVQRESPLPRSSAYRGVTRHRWTGRYEAHLWDKHSWNESQNKKGRQVYLGAYSDEETAARAYDMAALKYWGRETVLNFPVSSYQEELKEMVAQTREEYIGSLRRKSSGFSRGVSKYRGVARHHHNGRWEARIGRVFGNKYLYLGTYATQEEAAAAYDMAAIEYRGINAVTNFGLSRYTNSLSPSCEGNTESHPAQDQQQQQQQHPDQFGLLLQSPKLREMLERTAPSPAPESDDKPLRCSFPDDIQTYFECHDSESFADGDDTIFGELGAFEAPIFQCLLDI